MLLGFGFDDGFHHQLATVIEHSDHDRFLVHVHSDILNLATHFSCLLGRKIAPRQRSLSLKHRATPSEWLLDSETRNYPDAKLQEFH